MFNCVSKQLNIIEYCIYVFIERLYLIVNEMFSINCFNNFINGINTHCDFINRIKAIAK